jgi:hypothetical protein
MGKRPELYYRKSSGIRENSNLKVALFFHYSIYPNGIHSLWNNTEVFQLINNYSCVKARINGYNHVGNHVENNGIYFVTMQGMVEPEFENSFSVVSFTVDKI